MPYCMQDRLMHFQRVSIQAIWIPQEYFSQSLHDTHVLSSFPLRKGIILRVPDIFSIFLLLWWHINTFRGACNQIMYVSVCDIFSIGIYLIIDDRTLVCTMKMAKNNEIREADLIRSVQWRRKLQLRENVHNQLGSNCVCLFFAS